MATLSAEDQNHPRPLAIILALGAMGIYGMTGQIILVRELLVIFYGSELSLGLIFACWLLWVSVGAAVASRTTRRLSHPAGALLIAVVLALFVLPIEIGLVRCLRGILGTPPGLLIPLSRIVLATVLLLLPLSFLIGYTFPLGARLYARRACGAARKIGLLYVSETAGSVLGATLFTLLFAGRTSHFLSMAILGLPLVGSAILLTMNLPRGPSRLAPAVASMAGALLAIFLLAGGAPWLEKETAALRWEYGHPGIELLESRDSRYQHLTVGRISDQVTLFANGSPIESLPDTYDAGAAAHLLMVQQPSPTRVLLIGGGTPGFLAEVLKHPVRQLDYVEMDPELIRLTRRYSSQESRFVFDDPRLHVHARDGRAFLRESDEKYDFVIVLLPDPSTATLNRFYTVEFFRQVSARLAPRGAFVFDVGGAVNYMGAEVGPYRGILFQSLRSVFPHVLVTPGQRNFFFGSPAEGVLSGDAKELASRYTQRGVDSPVFSPLLYSSLLAPERMTWLRRELEQYSDAGMNRDQRPISYFHSILLWDRFSGSQIGSALQWIAHLKLRTVIALLAGVLALRIVWTRARPKSARSQPLFNSLSTIATTGFIAMGIQLAILFSFQNQLGYIYEKVGLVAAAFMVGLFLGGRWASAVVARIKPCRMLGWSDLAILALCLALPALLGAAASFGKTAGAPATETWFYVLACLSGGLAAFQFPLASRIYLERRENVAIAAGQVDCADHIGAALGALVAGSLLIPLLGVTQTCLLLAAVKAANLVLLVHAGRTS